MENNNFYPEIYIGENGNWFVNDYDTGVKAQGETGTTPHIGENGNWFIGDADTGLKAQGPQGLIGPQGPTGATGSQGLTGPKGEPGLAGQSGPQGCQGPKGDRGDIGPVGPKGDKGDIGSAGPKGDRGDMGPVGPKGEKGDQGYNGLQGAIGPKGDKGATGSQGPKGDTGTQGKQGIQGPAGPKGDKGLTGDRGSQGIPGPVNIADNLTTERVDYALSARQGKELNSKLTSTIDDILGCRLWFFRKIVNGNSSSREIVKLSALRSHFGNINATRDNFQVIVLNGDGSVTQHVDGVTYVNDAYYATLNSSYNGQVRFYVTVIHYPNGCEILS